MDSSVVRFQFYKNNTMKSYKYILLGVFSILLAIPFFTTSCTEDEKWETTLYEKGVMDLTYTDLNIVGGESITFTDLSTRVYERTWTIKGSETTISTDSVLTVTFKHGGTYTATLDVIFIDNQSSSYSFDFDVEGDLEPPVVGYGIYSENSGLGEILSPVLEPNNGYTISTTDQSFEGDKALLFEFSGVDTWGVMASIKPSGGTADISDYANGYYNISIRTLCDKKMLLRLQSASGKGIITLDPVAQTYGLTRDGNWCTLKIPMTDFTNYDPNLDLTKISDYLVLRSGEASVLASEDWDFYIDHIYLSLE